MSLRPCHIRGKLEAGCDEAGRGCLAGPVFAAAVILPANFNCPELNDSKKLSEKQRLSCRDRILEQALAWGVGVASPQEIDRINILKASFLAMHRAIEKLQPPPELLLIDGNRFIPYAEVEYLCVVGGDGTYQSIAAASILAKTFRDAHMQELDQHFPAYGWASNKGYPTKAHREALLQWGPTPHHRRSYQLLPPQQGTLF